MGKPIADILKKSFLFADKNWFGHLYEQYWEVLYITAYRHVRSQETAEEIVQEVFKSLWERRHEIVINGPVENYLSRAVKLKVLEYFRTQASHRRHLDCAMEEHCRSSECTENDVLLNDLKARVTHLVDRLPCQCRNVYKMSREQGLSNKEIASSLLISEKAVEYHISKALAFFRKNLGDYTSHFLPSQG